MKANMFLHCFLRQVIISLSSMSCCNQALTRFANNLKGIAHPWTLQIKTRPEQKLKVCFASAAQSEERAVHEQQQREQPSPNLTPQPSILIFYGEDLSSATKPGTHCSKPWCSHLKCPACVEVVVVLFWKGIGKANNIPILRVVWSLNSWAGVGRIPDQARYPHWWEHRVHMGLNHQLFPFPSLSSSILRVGWSVCYLLIAVPDTC